MAKDDGKRRGRSKEERNRCGDITLIKILIDLVKRVAIRRRVCKVIHFLGLGRQKRQKYDFDHTPSHGDAFISRTASSKLATV